MEGERSIVAVETADHQSDIIVGKKLERLSDPKTLFGIRFMNRKEYENICRAGKPVAREVYIPAYNHTMEAVHPDGPISFDEYMKHATKNWQWAIHSQTLWGEQTLWAMDTNFQLWYMMREAHKDAQKKIEEQTSSFGFKVGRTLGVTQRMNMRDETLNNLRTRFAQICGDGKSTIVPHDWPLSGLVRAGWSDVGNTHQADYIRKKIGDDAMERVLTMLEELAQASVGSPEKYADLGPIERILDSRPDKNFSTWDIMKEIRELFEIRCSMLRNAESSKRIRDFAQNGLMPTREQLRSILEAIQYDEGIDQYPPYHIALVVGKEAIGREGNLNHWHILRGDENDHPKHEGNPAHGVLGAISLIRDRGLIEAMTELSKNSGAMAHPIFDKRGRVRYSGRKPD